MADKYLISNNDKSIIRQLEINSRFPLTKIAKKTRKSQQRVSYTIQSLLRRDIIKNFYTLIDYSRLNVISFRVYFKVNYISNADFKALIKALQEKNDTSWIATCGGEYDLISTFFSLNPSQFNKNLKKLISNFPKLIHSYVILTTAVIREY